MRARRRPAQQGLTLIELMVAMLLSSILFGFVFSIVTRMSLAYRAQTGVSELQQSLRAAKGMLLQEMRNAGSLIPNGFTLANAGAAFPTETFATLTGPVAPLTITNANNGWSGGDPDKIRVFYADGSAAARIDSSISVTSVQVDDTGTFAPDDFVVIVEDKGALVPNNAATGLFVPAQLARYNACVVRLTNVIAGTPGTLVFDGSGAPYNSATNDHCKGFPTGESDLLQQGRMIYRLRGAAFRINPNEPEAGILEYSPTGELVPDDWQPVGLGFVNLQIAGRYYEESGPESLADVDNDTDPKRDWYSGSVLPPASAELMQLSVSLSVRTTRDMNLVPSQATPNFEDPDENGSPNPDHNRLGDSPSLSFADMQVHDQYRGNHIYRGISVLIDVRNLGVGR